MPTRYEFQELYDNCTYNFTTIDGVDGLLFTSNINGKSVFFPTPGFYNGPSLSGHGSYGYYWSSSHSAAEGAFILFFGSSSVNPQLIYARRYGFTVRAVRDP